MLSFFVSVISCSSSMKLDSKSSHRFRAILRHSFPIASNTVLSLTSATHSYVNEDHVRPAFSACEAIG